MKDLTTEQLYERRQHNLSAATTYHLVQRDYDQRRGKLQDRAEQIQRQIDELDKLKEQADNGGALKAMDRVREIDEELHRRAYQPKVDRIKALRAKLAEELGVDPSEVTRVLEDKIAEMPEQDIER